MNMLGLVKMDDTIQGFPADEVVQHLERIFGHLDRDFQRMRLAYVYCSNGRVRALPSFHETTALGSCSQTSAGFLYRCTTEPSQLRIR